MHKKLSKNLRIFVVKIFELFIFDSYDAQIHTEGKLILDSKKFFKNLFVKSDVINPFLGHGKSQMCYNLVKNRRYCFCFLL